VLSAISSSSDLPWFLRLTGGDVELAALPAGYVTAVPTVVLVYYLTFTVLDE
jgi:hypothetical protein